MKHQTQRIILDVKRRNENMRSKLFKPGNKCSYSEVDRKKWEWGRKHGEALIKGWGYHVKIS